MRRVSSWPPMMMNARWTSTSAPLASASTAAESSTSPCRYSVFLRPSARGSNSRRAMPSTRATSRRRSSARRNARPISPVGPVTAIVSPSGILVVEDDTPALDARLERLDVLPGRPLEQRLGAVVARQPLERLDRREDHQQLVRLGALQRARRLEPARVHGLLPVRLRLLSGRRGGEVEPRVEADADLLRRDPVRERDERAWVGQDDPRLF